MKSFSRLFLASIVIVGIGAGIYFWKTHSSPAYQTPTASSTTDQNAGDSPPPAQYPIEAQNGAPLTAPAAGTANVVKANSETGFTALFRDLIGDGVFDLLFKADGLVRKVVVMIENATGPKEPTWEFSPFKPLDSKFATDGDDANITISKSNYDRYKPYVEVARGLDVDKLVDLYVRFYPEFQKAYGELGTQKYFNDRLVEVVDRLLATPNATEPIVLVRSPDGRLFHYADPQLEALSGAQKMLIRMGADNAKVIKDKLRQIREKITHLGQPGK